MSEKPILFSTPMVQAILADRKTMTRRVVKKQPPENSILHGFVMSSTEPKNEGCVGWGPNELCANHYCKIPYQVGDVLWVRETWCKLWHLDINDQIVEGTDSYYYGADGYNPTPFNHFPDEDGFGGGRDCPKWKPSIHMPRSAARLFLKVTNIRVERLQDITEENAMAEGIDWFDTACYLDNGWKPTFYDPDSGGRPIFRNGFQHLWNKLNSKRGYGWELNPWVWVIEFERVGEPIC